MPFVALGQSLPEGFSREGVSVATEVRSTLIMSSRSLVRELGLFGRYEAELSREERTRMDALVPSWVPVSLIRAHYSALDRLALPIETQLLLGRGLSSRMHKPLFEIALRLAGAMGVTPWTLAEQATKMFPRAYNGGALLVREVGPKEARLEVLGFPCADLTYCQNAWRGIALGATELFSRRAFVNLVPSMCGQTKLGYRISWA